jgi:hypothetical protein
MDSMSGSLRDSEPTSPTSPASPDPTTGRTGATSPIALKQALNSLATSSPPNFSGVPRAPIIVDTEALISIEVLIMTGPEPVHIANIQFNNLDIIGKVYLLTEGVEITICLFSKPGNVSRADRLHSASISKISETSKCKFVIDCVFECARHHRFI